jgi:formate hydrogenlyase transcriptional activator
MEPLDKDLSLLISINDDIATIKDTENLFLAIFSKLHDYYGLKIVGIAFFDKNKKNLGFVVAKIDEQKSMIDSNLWLQSFEVDKIPFKLSLTNPEITYVDPKSFYTVQSFKDDQLSFEKAIEDLSINSLLMLPMKTGGELIGFLIFSSDEITLNEKDYDYSLKIANLIGSALKNASDYSELQEKEKEKEIQINLLVDLVTITENDVLYARLAEAIDKLIPCEYLAIYAKQTGMNLSKTFSLVKDPAGQFRIISSNQNVTTSILALKSAVVIKEGQNYIEIKDESLDKLCKQFTHLRQLKEKNSINSFLVIQYAYENLGELNIVLGRSNPFLWMNQIEKIELMYSQDKNAYFAGKEISLGLHILPQLGMILSNLYAFEEIRILTKKLEQEKNFLLDEINLSNSFQEIVGNSTAIQNTLNKVKQVAPLDATVLILGETGTGKELIAKAVHNLSKRKENTFITVNCAALPTQLIESELFGHEKGSFTGAVEKRIGKFEVADGGTIFLDEIGELPLEIQAKLLRVLQEKEFERLGGKSTIFSDVRIIAATNRNLEKEVAEGRFRADLFFRLNVFPILVPTLRERKDDIPLLVKYFTDKYSKKVGKEVRSIGKNDLDMLMQYNFPGNIRELEHFIERAIIISEGSNLNFEKLLGGSVHKIESNLESFRTLLEIEKEHIINALKITNGKVTGENSASQLLGINGKTLGSRMRKLGIKREINITSK